MTPRGGGGMRRGGRGGRHSSVGLSQLRQSDPVYVENKLSGKPGAFVVDMGNSVEGLEHSDPRLLKTAMRAVEAMKASRDNSGWKDTRESIISGFNAAEKADIKGEVKSIDYSKVTGRILDPVTGMGHLIKDVPAAQGTPVANLQAATKTATFTLKCFDRNRTTPEIVTPVKGYPLEIPNHVIQAALKKENVKATIGSKVLWKSVKIGKVCQDLVHGGGAVAVAVAVKTPERFRDQPHGPMTGVWENDKKIYKYASQIPEFNALLVPKHALTPQEKENIAGWEKEIEKTRSKINADADKPRDTTRVMQVKAHEQLLKALQDSITLVRKIADDRMKKSAAAGTGSQKKLFNYLVSQKLEKLIASSAREIASRLGQKATGGKEAVDLMMNAMKEHLPHVYDRKNCVDSDITLFQTDAIEHVTNEGAEKKGPSKSKDDKDNSFLVRIAEIFALVDFDHECFLEAKKHALSKDGDYATITRVIPKSGHMMMLDPTLDAEWWKGQFDEKTRANSRYDSLGYLMLITAPVVLWRQFKQKFKAEDMTDQKWKDFVSQHFDKDTGKLQLDRKLFYEQVDQISRLSTLYDTITDLNHVNLVLVPMMDGVIHANTDKDGTPLGKRGTFVCEVELSFVVLSDAAHVDS